MIDKNKYLYWLNADNPNLEEVIYREMYSRIGYILHVVQMIEYNIANILSLEEYEEINSKFVSEKEVNEIKENINKKYKELSSLMFGQLGKLLKKSKYLSNIDLDKLGNIIDSRNYIVHQCFKEKLLQNGLLSLDEVDKFIEELNEYECLIVSFNEELLEVFKKHKIKQVLIWKDVFKSS